MTRVEQFIAARRDRWARFELLLKRKIGRLSGDEILELGRLYRVTASDLAIARRDFPAERVTVYLNRLVARAHPIVYQDRVMDLRRIAWFLRYGFPGAYRAAGRYIAFAFGVFALSALVSALLVVYRSSMADVLLPGQAQDLRSVMAQHHLWMKSATENHSVAANFIMLNNIQVAFLAFAGGILLGTYTIWVMAQNGIMLGTVGAMVAQYGLSEQFWSFVVPHGAIELSVIFMAGGAGLMIGDSVLRPGLEARRDALTDACRRATVLALGAVPLLIIAGTIEAFFSPSDAPDVAKYALGLVLGIGLYAYFLLSRPGTQVERYMLEDISNPEEVIIPPVELAAG